MRDGPVYAAKVGDRPGRDRVPHAGDRAGALPPLQPLRPHALHGLAEPGRPHLHARASRRLASSRRWRKAAARQRVHRQEARCWLRPPARPGQHQLGALGLRPHDGLLQVPRGAGERDRPAPEGLEPHRQGARLPGRSHPPRRLRLPRRALPLRPALEPLRRHGRAQGLPRPLPRRVRGGGRELPQHRQPERHSQRGGLAQLRRLAARRVADSRGHLLEVDRARLARRAAADGQRPGREPRPLRHLSAEAHQLQRDDQRLQPDRSDAQAAELHRRPVRRPREGLLPAGPQPAGGAPSHQRRQARRRDRNRGVRGARLRAVQRHAELQRGPDRPGARQALRRRRPVALPRAQVRQRAGRHAVRQRGRGRAGQHGEQVRDRPVLDRQPLRRPRSRQLAQPDRQPGGPVHDHALRARGRAAVRGPAPGLSPRPALQPEGPDRPRPAPDPIDDAQGHDRRDGSHEHEGAAAGPHDPRGGELPRRHLQPLLGRPRQPAAPAGARRNRRPDLEHVHRFRRGVGGGQGQPGPELPLRHGLRLRHQRAALPAQAAPERRAEPGPLPVSLLRRRQR